MTSMLVPLHGANRGVSRVLQTMSLTTRLSPAAALAVEHTIGRIRRYQAITMTDRNHRQDHTARVRAIAGLANRQIEARLMR